MSRPKALVALSHGLIVLSTGCNRLGAIAALPRLELGSLKHTNQALHCPRMVSTRSTRILQTLSPGSSDEDVSAGMARHARVIAT
jgi:hypothetical protein